MVEILAYADEVWNGTADTLAYHTGELQADGLHQVHPQVWTWPAFGNVHVLDTNDGLVLFDSGGAREAKALHAAVRAVFDKPVTRIIYSHGHVDHVFGVGPFDAEAREQQRDTPTVLAHENVVRRFDRYRRSAGYNSVINQRQFGAPGYRWPEQYRYPDVTYDTAMSLRVGGVQIQLRHFRGETDDATIAWLPDLGIVLPGDFFIWTSPNSGNPQKVQRFTREWAEAMQWIASLEANLLLPGHGLPLVGTDRIRGAVLDVAEFLTSLHDQTLAAMNRGDSLDDVINSVVVPADLLERPHLRPTYDEPEFVIRNLWRLYGGWYDGNPAHLKPAARADLASEIAALAGGPQQLADRALAYADDPATHRIAAHLAQYAADAAPDDPYVHRVRSQVFGALEKAATSTMTKGVYRWAKVESTSIAEGTNLDDELRKAVQGRRFRML